MSEAVNRFYNSIENASELSKSSLIELFVYFLTVESGVVAATKKQVDDCFNACDLSPPKNTAARLSEGLKTKPQKYLKKSGGYTLQRHMREALSKKLGAETTITQTSASLRGLEQKLEDGPAKVFLDETIDCFELGANRAAIVMAWILTMDHLFSYILKNRLSQFNLVLAKNSDRRVKVTVITQRDDFTEMPEAKFIELCRSAKIISNDVRKILDQKLGTRNSSAHPSGISVSKSKTIDFIEDLVENIVLKYEV